MADPGDPHSSEPALHFYPQGQETLLEPECSWSLVFWVTEIVWKSQGLVLKSDLNLAASAEPQNQQILLQGGFPPAYEPGGPWSLATQQETKSGGHS